MSTRFKKRIGCQRCIPTCGASGGGGGSRSGVDGDCDSRGDSSFHSSLFASFVEACSAEEVLEACDAQPALQEPGQQVAALGEVKAVSGTGTTSGAAGETDFLLGEQYTDVRCSELASFACALGTAAVSKILEEMSRAPDTYFRGMPDLCFWKKYAPSVGEDEGEEVDLPFVESASGRDTNLPWVVQPDGNTEKHDHENFPLPRNPNVFLVEVKSVNDRISRFQLCWVELLQSCGVLVEVAKVVHRD